MDSLINQAKEHSTEETNFRDQNIEEFEEFGKPQIVVVGCGGAGNNTINRLYRIGVEGAETIAINTDKQHLDMIKADKRILVGKSLTKGLGAGGYPELGEKAAETARGTLEDVLEGADLVFITAGMGGGTGTGVSPVVAEVAKDQGAIVVGMVSTPFNVERARLKKAERGLERLRQEADTAIVLDNNRLLDYVPDLPIKQAFSVMDQLIAETVKGLSETITQPSLINLDYADVKTIMSCGGVAVMLIGETGEEDKSGSVVREALNHPLLDVDYEGATGCLVHITGGSDLTLKESESVAQELTYELDSNSNVIWGARINENYDGKVRVMAIMTGVNSSQVMNNGNGRCVNREQPNLTIDRIK
ncbi:cell division protein FtsZ [Methanonatronarchaeum sp. AMET-Sl]|uniref:cell division protein FtsZ n=1 Tax=Methanonatronarchaeum sp. AMET-Sl TaxID=3037654 RepID=UPI00326784EF